MAAAAGDDEIALARRTRGFMALEEADRLTYKFPSHLSFALVSTHSVVVRSAYTYLPIYYIFPHCIEFGLMSSKYPVKCKTTR